MRRTLPDNLILASVIALREQRPKESVVLVSKDINLRIKATINGITAEDYYSDRAAHDTSALHGPPELPADFWDKHGKGMESWQQSGHTFY